MKLGKLSSLDTKEGESLAALASLRNLAENRLGRLGEWACLPLKLFDLCPFLDIILEVGEATRPALEAAAIQQPYPKPRSFSHGKERADF